MNAAQGQQAPAVKPPASFVAWANDYSEAARVRIKAHGGTGTGGTARWWRLLPDDLRCFLLSTQDPDGWQRWMGCEWQALPDGMRQCIAGNARELRRALEGCTWR